MVRRLFDLAVAFIILVLASPILLFVACVVKLSSSGPVFYRAVRTGKGGRTFLMYKVRTMHLLRNSDKRIKITAEDDPRIFPAGAVIRKLKIDELPQLWNVLKGDMALVGPRPEDPEIVRAHYNGWQYDTLVVRPGVASPGSLFNYVHGNEYIDPADPEGSYVKKVLPRKLALDLVCVRNTSFRYDLGIIWQTVLAVILMLFGKQNWPPPPEAGEASRISGFDY